MEAGQTASGVCPRWALTRGQGAAQMAGLGAPCPLPGTVLFSPTSAVNLTFKCLQAGLLPRFEGFVGGASFGIPDT